MDRARPGARFGFWGCGCRGGPMDSREPKRRRKSRKGRDAAGGGAPEGSGVNEFTQLALYMAASLAGMVTALLVARRPFFESLLRSVGGGGVGRGKRRAKRGGS